MVNQHFGRESFQDPLMLDAFFRGHSFGRVPLQTLLYKIDKRRVLVRIEDVLQALGAWLASFAILVGVVHRQVLFVEKLGFALAHLQQV